MKVETWRKSSLKSMLEGCSWQWMLEQMSDERYASPHASAGTGFHQAMEDWEVSGRTLTEGQLKDAAAQAALAEARSVPMEQWFEHQMDPEYVMELAAESVRVWWNEPAKSKQDSYGTLREILLEREHIASERFIKTDYAGSGVPISGTIDWIGRKGDTIHIVDFKTASSFRKWVYDQPAGIEEAVYRYLTLADEELLASKVQFEWHVVSAKEGKARIIFGNNDNLTLLKVLDTAISEANVLLKYDAFRPRPDWNLCQRKWCAFYQGCQVDGSLSPSRLPASVASYSGNSPAIVHDAGDVEHSTPS